MGASRPYARLRPSAASLHTVGIDRTACIRSPIAKSCELRTANCFYVGVAATVTGRAASAGRASSTGHTYTASRRE